MSRGLVFAGTSDGRLLGQRLAEAGIALTVRVATEYGEALLKRQEHFEVLSGRLTTQQMIAYLKEEAAAGCGFDFVVDATHPYAQQVSDHIRQSVKEWNLLGGKNCQYFRLLREQEQLSGVVLTDSSAEAVSYLNDHTGNILLTTGSKDLETFTQISNYAERCYLRVLPCEESVVKCRTLGFPPSHIIAMQGPFSEKLNLALLEEFQIRYLVTKESGKIGGFPEKISAAQKAGVIPVVMKRPAESEGYFFEPLFRLICDSFTQESERSSL